MENETVKSLGVPLGHALSSATKFVDLSQKSTGFDARGKENFFRGSGRCSVRKFDRSTGVELPDD